MVEGGNMKKGLTSAVVLLMFVVGAFTLANAGTKAKTTPERACCQAVNKAKE
jgi:hypothetical protein